MYHSKQSGKKGYLLFEDLNDLPNAQFLSPWVADAELAKKVTAQMCENTMTGLAKLHARFWESAEFGGAGALASFATRGRGLQDGQSKETVQNHFLYKQGWGKYLGFGILEGEPALKALGEKLLVDFPVLYARAFAEGECTFIHGDTGIYNMMFYGDGEPCLFDWQMCQKGKGIFDVAFFLVLSTPSSFLAANEDRFLQLYHQALTAGGAVHYTLVQLKEDYRFAVAATWAIIVYVAGLLATKGAEWTEPIKIGAGRTVAAMKRLEVDGLVTAFLEGKKQK